MLGHEATQAGRQGVSRYDARAHTDATSAAMLVDAPAPVALPDRAAPSEPYTKGSLCPTARLHKRDPQHLESKLFCWNSRYQNDIRTMDFRPFIGTSFFCSAFQNGSTFHPTQIPNLFRCRHLLQSIDIIIIELSLDIQLNEKNLLFQQ